MKSMILFLFLSVGQVARAAEPCVSVPHSKVEIDRATNKFLGCKLQAVETNSTYAKLGLKEGDIVRPNSSDIPKSVEPNNKSKTQE